MPSMNAYAILTKDTFKEDQMAEKKAPAKPAPKSKSAPAKSKAPAKPAAKKPAPKSK